MSNQPTITKAAQMEDTVASVTTITAAINIIITSWSATMGSRFKNRTHTVRLFRKMMSVAVTHRTL